MFTGRRTISLAASVLVSATMAGCASSGGAGQGGQASGPRAGSASSVSVTGAWSAAWSASSSATATASVIAPGPSPSGRGAALTRAQAQARCTAVIMSGLTRTERAGQVLMVGVPAGSATSVTRTVAGYQVGGVFLRGRSRISATVLRRQLAAVQAASRRATGVPVHVAVDHEGGQVQTLSGPGFVRLPTARVQGTWSTATLSARSRAAAKALRAAGITLNLAPVADTVSVADRLRNPPIGKPAREFGSTPAAVAADVSAVVAAGRVERVGTAAKHFPGLGRVRANTDTSASAVDAVTTARDPNLAPFSAAIGAGTPMVMISSARYPELDEQRIAPFSPAVVTTLLRRHLGFTGVAVSDDLGSAKALASVPIGSRAVRFVGAGGDLVLTVTAGHAPIMRKALLAQAARSPAFARRLDEAATRVIAGKVAAGLIGCTAAQIASPIPAFIPTATTG